MSGNNLIASTIIISGWYVIAQYKKKEKNTIRKTICLAEPTKHIFITIPRHSPPPLGHVTYYETTYQFWLHCNILKYNKKIDWKKSQLARVECLLFRHDDIEKCCPPGVPFIITWLDPPVKWSNCEACVWLCDGMVKSRKSKSVPCVSAPPISSCSSVSKKVRVCEFAPYVSTLIAIICAIGLPVQSL